MTFRIKKCEDWQLNDIAAVHNVSRQPDLRRWSPAVNTQQSLSYDTSILKSLSGNTVNSVQDGSQILSMAGLWQQLLPLQQGRALLLLPFICLFYPPSSAIPWDSKASPLPLKGFEVVKGNFSRTFLRVGYHKITEIPAGACNISIQETIKSRNYLALQTQSGVSIINGNWVIDRPGIFTAVGTELTYKRPNEIRSRNGESITSPGPLSEDLHVYLIYQQPGPRVYYEYIVPLQSTTPTPEQTTPAPILPLAETVGPIQPGEKEHQGEVTNNDIIKEKPHPNQIPPEPSVKPQPTYTWTNSGRTECSTTCGTGVRYSGSVLRKIPRRLFLLTSVTLRLNQKTREKSATRSPVLHTLTWGVVRVQQEVWAWHSAPPGHLSPGSRQWDGDIGYSGTGAVWDCSVPCGVGQRSREVVCVSNQGEVEEDEECNMNLRPDNLQNCDMGACARSWFTSLWSQRCSTECGQGNQTRTAVCLMDHVTDLPLDSCEGERPAESKSCDSGPCKNSLEWYTGPWGQCSAECGNGTQSRSVACIFNDDDRMEVVDQFKCSSLSQPITAQPCRLKPCGVQWYVTEWSVCSRSCNTGYRVREVRCLADNISPSDRCDPTLTPESREECNKHPCVAEINPSCSDQYHNCVVVVQARLCVYPYYRSVCCASCSRSHKKYPNSFQRNHIRR
ncbi:hypothetical protein F7725_005484 [Dissostichus mawsoni]|uniref:PLAC domain-containing protein n=1 Tax=Dissostichus mawsoni TaxID=36200 RepID=A0A7J5YTV0_DISMA|nr:hypothetical protein F7725_005484 [Dissostichus mawsoni]